MLRVPHGARRDLGCAQVAAKYPTLVWSGGWPSTPDGCEGTEAGRCRWRNPTSEVVGAR